MVKVDEATRKRVRVGPLMLMGKTPAQGPSSFRVDRDIYNCGS